MRVHESKRVVFLCSGGGGNLSFLYHAIRLGVWNEGEIVGVLTDRDCVANELSERLGLYNRVLDAKDPQQSALIEAIDMLRPDLVITTFHKILCPALVARYAHRLLNLHYSLLPAFAGLIGTAPVRAALDQKLLFTGVTVHFVDEQVDAGLPLVQGVIALRESEELSDLMPVVFRAGCIALMRALTVWAKNAPDSQAPLSVNLLGRDCLFNGGGGGVADSLLDESFWEQVQSSIRA